MGVSGQLDTLATLILREEPPVPFAEYQWVPETVSAFWRGDKNSLILLRIKAQFLLQLACSLISTLTQVPKFSLRNCGTLINLKQESQS